ncbi:Heat shock protein HslJ [Chitinophaga costaii]|uniref:Heat shock protein HslJ n=1 Tax=Chitinophaga costaii TaxID=1335309 RepID=A0A1C4G2Z6_9BACT|nr:META domain-containing protein [Chitinophaga costaii]SCC62560.1 Heat shock protein HslJ [Chitinophaga costaii]
MKSTFLIGCLLLASWFGPACSSSKPFTATKASRATSANPSLLYGTDWKLVSLQGEAIDTAGLRKRPGLRFDKAEHRVSGNGGCNSIGGSFTVTGDKLHFSPMISTKMACPAMDVENKFLQALAQVTRFDVSEGRLELLNEQGSLAILGSN